MLLRGHAFQLDPGQRELIAHSTSRIRQRRQTLIDQSVSQSPLWPTHVLVFKCTHSHTSAQTRAHTWACVHCVRLAFCSFWQPCPIWKLGATLSQKPPTFILPAKLCCGCTSAGNDLSRSHSRSSPATMHSPVTSRVWLRTRLQLQDFVRFSKPSCRPPPPLRFCRSDCSPPSPPPPPPLSLSLSLSHTHTHTLSLSLSPSLSLTHTLPFTHPHTLPQAM